MPELRQRAVEHRERRRQHAGSVSERLGAPRWPDQGVLSGAEVEQRLALELDAHLIRHALRLELAGSRLEWPGRMVDVDPKRPPVAIQGVGAVALREPAGQL